MPKIVGGSAHGRHIKSPAYGVRPATARARKALFDHLAGLIPGARVLDLYSGSGGLGLEALSRGAAEAWFVDKSQRSIRIARENAERLGFSDRSRFAQRDVFAFLKHFAGYDTASFDLIFAAPPYRIAEPARILEVIAISPAISPGAAVCLEYARHTPAPKHPHFQLDRRREYGETVVEIWDFIGTNE